MTDDPWKLMPAYPAWVCADCGAKWGRRQPTVATWHVGTCGVCGREAPVTEPRDFGGLRIKAVDTRAHRAV